MDMSTPRMNSTAARAAYDPRYDPLVAPHPGQGTDYAPTYWVATAGEPPADDGPIRGARSSRLHRPTRRTARACRPSR